MRKMKKIFWTLVICCFIFVPSVGLADELDLFSYNVSPDVLIVLDLSGSMEYAAVGRYMYTDSTQHCKSTTVPFYPDATHSGYTARCDYIDTWTPGIPVWAADETCSPPFYIGSGTGHTTDCSRVAIAKRAIKNLLDYDNNKKIDSNDEKNFKVRIGYMRYSGAEIKDDSPWDYTQLGKYITQGGNTLRVGIPTTDPFPCESCCSYCDLGSAVDAEANKTIGGTPLAPALEEAAIYLDFHDSNDLGKSCRQKFVVLITDGQDTRSCGGNGSENEIVNGVDIRYKGRKASVAAAYNLWQNGQRINATTGLPKSYKLFVIGFGADLPQYLANTLEWMAYYGGTNNPDATDSQIPNPIPITPTSYTPNDYSKGTGACAANSSNDPASATITGYAYFASNAQALSDSLTKAFNYIASSRLSFSVSTVAAFRTTAENYLYQASFQPLNGDPFWLGHLQKYNLNSDGSLGSMIWDAGDKLKSRNYSTRKLYTLLSGAVVPFSDSSGPFSPPGQGKEYFGVGTGTQATAVQGYILGNPTYNPDGWYLGDIFHSNVMSIGSPSLYFTDFYAPKAYESFQGNNASRQRIVMVGANDGQFHAFNADNGSEMWSFIPPNQLPRLPFIAHKKDPTTLVREYFVDGGASAADVWLGSGDGKSKSVDGSEWRTLLVFGEGRGVRDATNRYPIYQWSSSSTCDSQSPTTDFTKDYDSIHKYYCGYYAFDVTDTAANHPTLYPPLPNRFLNFTGDSPQTQQYLGEPWSKMVMGRVRKDGDEKWVGFIGGGYATEANRGKGFFVVDLSDGHVLWSYTYAENSSMNYPVPGSPAIVDTDNDGFVDTAYVGDLGGNVWRFKFCTNADVISGCGTGNWSGKLLYDASGSGSPIYTTPTTARGDGGSLWVFWGTGDLENPVSTTGQDRVFAIKDDRTSTYTISNLQDISGSGTLYDGKKPGWVISFAGTGEKSLSDPTVFGGILLFTTYTPDSSDTNPCSRTGSSRLYAVAMMRVAITTNGANFTYDPGAGVFSTPASASSTAGGARSVTLGAGIGKGPVLSQNPQPGMATDLYITLSGGGTTNTSVITNAQLGSSPLIDRLSTTYPSTQLLDWRDGRLQ